MAVKRVALTLVIPMLLSDLWASQAAGQPRGRPQSSGPAIVDVRKIWDQAPHCAFTDLVRRQDRWWCVFREGQGHVSPAGTIRVITSADGRAWESAASLRRADTDLRDPKISLMPDGRLMLLAAASWHADDAPLRRQPLTWFSNDGREWTSPIEIGEPNYWLWRVAWQDGAAYGVGYGVGEQETRQVRLYKSRDGRNFETLVDNLFDEGSPNESSLLFEGDHALCILRRDGEPNTAVMGTTRAPYTEWSWQDLGVRIGGPHLIRLSDGRIVAAGRFYDGGARTGLAWLDPQQATLTEFLRLPSGGDTSYPGMVEHDGLLWVSYYSSHEGKANIYLARVRLP